MRIFMEIYWYIYIWIYNHNQKSDCDGDTMENSSRINEYMGGDKVGIYVMG